MGFLTVGKKTKKQTRKKKMKTNLKMKSVKVPVNPFAPFGLSMSTSEIVIPEDCYIEWITEKTLNGASFVVGWNVHKGEMESERDDRTKY